MSAHNLGTVIGFETRRTLQRPSFWIATLSVPLLMIALFALSFFSSAGAANASKGDGPIPFTYTDASGLISPQVAQKAGGSPTQDAAAARQAVSDGRAQLHIDYPKDATTEPIVLTGADRGLGNSGPYTTLARGVLVDSVQARIGNESLVNLLTDPLDLQVHTFSDGQETPGPGAAILPGGFLLLFYFAILMLGNQMLNITLEEKENRVTEMILTTMKPLTLILGKILALLLVGITQALVISVPVIVVLGMLGQVTVPGDEGNVSLNIAGSALTVDPLRIVIAAALFIAGFAMFTGLLVSIGSVMPNAKEAGSAFGLVVLVLFLPVYVLGMVLSEPHGVVSQALTYFPLTAPVTALLRNALGTLSPLEAVGALASTGITAAVLIWVGVQLFRTGSLSYDQRLNIAKALSSSKS
ncbi:ABC transporter permease [Nigerium massiliense]|uniref:ABC transporter permease n=1 Tax=Nigerium massiliense TaxID=1522317 RepID=UPI00058C0C43|nr:ABC transporter permease [Nigerium massiliense]